MMFFKILYNTSYFHIDLANEIAGVVVFLMLGVIPQLYALLPPSVKIQENHIRI